MSAFTPDPGWLPFCANPSRPRFRLPAGAVDAHCHVFGPGARFPYAPERRYTPVDAPKEKLWQLRDLLGFERNVIVQATCHGSDNRALVDALQHAAGRARGVVTLPAEISDRELEALHAAGVRGVRFSFVRRLTEAPAPATLRAVAERIRAFGWHLVVYFEPEELPALYRLLAELPVPVVIDHMGRPEVTQPVDGPAFTLFQQLLRENAHVWSKVGCPERLSRSGLPDYADVVPFARRVVESFPDRVLWGTDWPHPNLTTHMPDDGALVDWVPSIAPTADLQRRLLRDNPRRLYWPELEL